VAQCRVASSSSTKPVSIRGGLSSSLRLQLGQGIRRHRSHSRMALPKGDAGGFHKSIRCPRKRCISFRCPMQLSNTPQVPSARVCCRARANPAKVGPAPGRMRGVRHSDQKTTIKQSAAGKDTYSAHLLLLLPPGPLEQVSTPSSNHSPLRTRPRSGSRRNRVTGRQKS
jgi:hypothetical protein